MAGNMERTGLADAFIAHDGCHCVPPAMKKDLTGAGLSPVPIILPQARLLPGSHIRVRFRCVASWPMTDAAMTGCAPLRRRGASGIMATATRRASWISLDLASLRHMPMFPIFQAAVSLALRYEAKWQEIWKDYWKINRVLVD